MNIVPVIPDSAPFALEQRAWLNGYLAGLFSRGSVDPAVRGAVGAAPALQPLTILFGSQTGTAEGLAKRLAKEAGRHNFAPTVREMSAVTAEQLAQERNVLLITSTYGDGEPPDNAKALHAALTRLAAAGASPALRLPQLRFSSCGLGDTNYVHFCQCAQDFDLLLEKLGAVRVAPRVDCDLEYEAKFAAWSSVALGALAGAAPAPAAPVPAEAGSPAAGAEPAGYHRNNPFPALLLTSRLLNAPGSAKQVHHVEFDLTDSGLSYEAGDALGVYAHNCPALVDDLLASLGCDGEEAVAAPDGASVPLRRALTEMYDLGRPTPELLDLVRATAGRNLPVGARSGSTPSEAGAPHHVVDAVAGVSAGGIAPAEFVRRLKRLQPRLYSISSSPRTHAGRVHLTVGAVRYAQGGRDRKGVCSTFLADRASPGAARVGVFVHSNRAFRPPANDDAPMIMIGPGTGIAPFRAFLHERAARGARGRNWLFFGDQRAATDFLYREEIEEFCRLGLLSRIDTAFSRDQTEKVYVQHRMLEQADELFAWLEAGAHLYVCGDATRMAKDVDAALHRVIEKAGARTPEAAAAYVEQLKATKRYARDVY